MPSRFLYNPGVAAVEILARAGGTHAERLVCHPRLSLVAALDSERPAVHIWDCGGGSLAELGTVGASAVGYPEDGWQRRLQTPALAWHPDQPYLAVAGRGAVTQWTPAGTSALNGSPPGSGYLSLAFSPDGRTLWATPSWSPDGVGS
jgi:WD40 repeat protein